MTDVKRAKDTADIKARTVALAGLASYQDGAVVSREIIGGKAGTVTVFAFDAGEQLSEHTAPYDALVVGLDGEGDITIGGRANRVRTGEMIIMPADVPHALRAVTRFKMLLVMIKKPA